jgi:hypothetical protein
VAALVARIRSSTKPEPAVQGAAMAAESCGQSLDGHLRLIYRLGQQPPTRPRPLPSGLDAHPGGRPPPPVPAALRHKEGLVCLENGDKVKSTDTWCTGKSNEEDTCCHIEPIEWCWLLARAGDPIQAPR